MGFRNQVGPGNILYLANSTCILRINSTHNREHQLKNLFRNLEPFCRSIPRTTESPTPKPVRTAMKLYTSRLWATF